MRFLSNLFCVLLVVVSICILSACTTQTRQVREAETPQDTPEQDEQAALQRLGKDRFVGVRQVGESMVVVVCRFCLTADVCRNLLSTEAIGEVTLQRCSHSEARGASITRTGEATVKGFQQINEARVGGVTCAEFSVPTGGVVCK